jgi:dynein heavy chain 2
MPEKNATHLNMAYERAEELFLKLDQLAASLMPWAVVQTLDPELVQTLLPDLERWEAFMKEVRVKRKDLEKIGDVQRIDCLTISLAPFKQ